MRIQLANTEFFDRQGDAAPLQAPKSYIRINFGREGTENCTFMFPKIHSFQKRRSAPLRPPEIIYFCKFRPKRA